MKKITLLLCLIYQLSFSQNYTSYTTGSVIDAVIDPDFGICMMGGASEHDEAMRWFLNKANGGDIVVLRASGSDGYNNYFYSDLGVTINSVITFVIHNENGALDPYVLDRIAKAEGIWFAGGDQYNYVSYFKNNAMETALNTFINTKQGVIGGTSAGMAILGNYYFDAANGTVTNAQALSNPYHSRVSLGYNDFLEIPFLESIITDTHYDDPDRRGRHSVFLARLAQDHNIPPFGIACNEYTAVCVDSDGKSYVYGDYPSYDEYAFFLQANCTLDYAPETCTNGVPLNWNQNQEALKVYKVPGTNSGTNYFDLSDWETGVGGNWENWYVNNGVLTTSVGTNPMCGSLSISEQDVNTIEIFPNPFKDILNIKNYDSDFSYKIFNILGVQIYDISITDNQINTEQLSSGIYFLKASNSNTFKISKIIKK